MACMGLCSTWGHLRQLEGWDLACQKAFSLTSLSFDAGCQLRLQVKAVSSNISMGLFHVAWASSQHGSWVPSHVLGSEALLLSVHFIYRGSHSKAYSISRGKGKESTSRWGCGKVLEQHVGCKIVLWPLLKMQSALVTISHPMTWFLPHSTLYQSFSYLFNLPYYTINF